MHDIECVNPDLKHTVDVRPVYLRWEDRHFPLCWLVTVLTVDAGSAAIPLAFGLPYVHLNEVNPLFTPVCTAIRSGALQRVDALPDRGADDRLRGEVNSPIAGGYAASMNAIAAYRRLRAYAFRGFHDLDVRGRFNS